MTFLLRLATPPAIVLAVVLAFMSQQAATVDAQAYQGDNLPANVLAASLNGQPIDGNSSPVVNDPTPTIAGQVVESSGTVSIRIVGSDQTFTATVDASGRFSAEVPQPLENGVHTLYFDGARIGTFTVATAAATTTPTASSTPAATPSVAPGPPATGAGSNATGQWSMAGAGIVGLAVAGSVFAMWAIRRRDVDGRDVR